MINPSNEFRINMQRWFAIMMHKSMAAHNRLARENGLSISQIMALGIVARRGPRTISEMAEKLGVSNAAASQLLEKLVQQGFISRSEDPNDRRSKIVTSTEKGRKMLETIHTNHSEWLVELENNLTETERQNTLNVLETLIQKANFLDKDFNSEHCEHP